MRQNAHPICAYAVHPRVCGEQLSVDDQVSNVAGSSPRVRGTGVIEQIRGIPIRFIPACAGNSASSTLLGAFSTVHPRVCGEQTFFVTCGGD